MFTTTTKKTDTTRVFHQGVPASGRTVRAAKQQVLDNHFNKIATVIHHLISIYTNIIHSGVNQDKSTPESRNITLSNWFGLTWSIMLTPFALMFCYYEPFVAILLLSIIGCHVLAISLNRHGHTIISRVMQSTYPQTVIFVTGVLVLKDPQHDNIASYHMLNLSFMVIPFLFFSFNEKKYIILSLGLSVLEYACFRKCNEAFHLHYASHIYHMVWFEMVMYGLSFYLLCVGFIYLRYVSEQATKKTQQALEETALRNKELHLRNNEIKEQRDNIETQKREIEVQNEALVHQTSIIMRQNRDITESLNYASVIQNAVIPDMESMKRYIPRSFVMFKPRDIVSGDFFWIKKQDQRLIIACADCTGHGVPGGFLSMLCITLLDETCRNASPSDNAANILFNLQDIFNRTFNNNRDEIMLREGMNISLCIYNTHTNELHFAGANQSLFVVMKGEVNQIRGNRIPIGFHSKLDTQFTNHQLDTDETMSFYMTTDGFTDQFRPHGDSYAKQGTPRFRTYLREIQDLDFEKQVSALETKYETWKINCEQTDDILVIGFKLP